MTSLADSLDALAAARAGIYRGTRGFTSGGQRRALRSVLPLLAILTAVSAISLLHYRTDVDSILLHEIFRRLYYVPIVVAAVVYGARGGLATSVLASLFYVPHVVLNWGGRAVPSAEPYGELILFNVVAAVTGFLADQLRAERNRYRHTAAELQQAYSHLETQTEERLRLDRLVTVGRIASGIAHEIRTPLGGILGCIEILESEFPKSHPKWEFFAIARKEMQRLETVVSEFLEFAEPAPPSARAVNLNEVVQGASRLARSSLVGRAVRIHVQECPAPPFAAADADHVQRAVLNLILGATSGLRDMRVDLHVLQTAFGPTLTIRIPGAEAAMAVADVFEPFPPSGGANGLALATARRLVENQHGSLRAVTAAGALEFVMELPPASRTGDSSSHPLPASTACRA